MQGKELPMGTLMFGVHGPSNRLIVDLGAVARIMGVKPSTLATHAEEHDMWDRRKRIKNRNPYLAGRSWAFFDWAYAIVHCASPASKRLTPEKRKEVCALIGKELEQSLLIAHFNRPLDLDVSMKP